MNGEYIFGAQNSGGSFLNAYDIDRFGLAAGNYVLQILREDHGGGTGYDILATAVVRSAASRPASGCSVPVCCRLAFVRRRRNLG